METNLPNQKSQLNSLLEKHKQLQERSAFKSYYQSQENNASNFSIKNNYYDTQNRIPQERLPTSTTMSKVYVNPNYARKKSVIHINPRVQMKPSIYVNPKLIQNFTSCQSKEQISKSIMQDNQTITLPNVPSKCSVHVNPKLISKLISEVPEKNEIVHQKQSIPIMQNKPISSLANRTDSSNTCVKNKSVSAVTSITKRKSLSSSTSISQRKLPTNFVIKSKTKLVGNSSVLKKSPNSSLVSLSRRKLVRIRKSPKSAITSTNSSKILTPLRRRVSSCGSKKTKTSPKNAILTSVSQFSKLNRSFDKYKTNWCNKVNKTASKSLCSKKTVTTKKSLNNSVAFVSIGGVTYKSSRNKLVQVQNPNCTPLKRRRSLVSSKNNQYYITKNGKKLLKLDSSKKKINTSVRSNSSISPNKNYKTNVSNKVKQRSLQILRNKMRKNNQPCLLFQRFGYCANQLAGTCPKVHDRNQVALCKNFLQGNCLLDNCHLSHNVGPEKMPTCKYFLEGCCARDGCPYLHVKVSSKSPICVEFLRGYCSQGNECQKRHILACPEFDKSGKCSKGKSCPYPHKSHLTETKRLKRVIRRKSIDSTAKRLAQITPVERQAMKCTKRYYDEVTEEDLSQKRETLLNRVKMIKQVHAAQSNASDEKRDNLEHSEVINTEDSENAEERLETVGTRPRRPPIGPLPSYIPIE